MKVCSSMLLLELLFFNVVLSGPIDSNFWNPKPKEMPVPIPRDPLVDHYTNELLYRTQHQVETANFPITRLSIFGHLITVTKIASSFCSNSNSLCYKAMHEASDEVIPFDRQALVVLVTRLIHTGTMQPTRIGKGVEFVYPDSRTFPYGVTTNYAVFLEDIQTAMKFQRTTDALLRANKLQDSLTTLHVFENQWKLIQERYAKSPPEVFFEDSQWRSSLNNISDFTSSAIKYLNNGESEKAKVVVSKIEDAMVSLRKRNYIRLWADYVINLDHRIQNLTFHVMSVASTAQQWDSSRDMVAVCKYLFSEVLANAPQEYSSHSLYISQAAQLNTALNEVEKYGNSRTPVSFENAKTELIAKWQLFWAQWF